MNHAPRFCVLRIEDEFKPWDTYPTDFQMVLEMAYSKRRPCEIVIKGNVFEINFTEMTQTTKVYRDRVRDICRQRALTYMWFSMSLKPPY